MNPIDWNAKATLQQRDDAGSDMFIAFDTIGEGPLSAMVAQVLQMSPHDRARVVLDVQGMGMLDVARIVELGKRADFPGC
jgi:hypothetical protein